MFFLCTLLIIIGAACFAYGRLIEPDRLTVKEITDVSYSMKEPLTVAVFADTHFGFNYSIGDFEKVVDEINSLDPDVIIFTGDLIDNLDEYNVDTTLISNKLGLMEANIGKYAVFGNHDYGGGAEYRYESIMAAGGFEVLKDEIITFPEHNLRLIGVDDALIGSGNPSIALNADAAMYNLVLCHEPDLINDMMDANIDMMVSSHTHGGQIRVPGVYKHFLPALGQDYIKGKYELDNQAGTILYVNAGLGTTKFPARFLSVPEITFITIMPD